MWRGAWRQVLAALAVKPMPVAWARLRMAQANLEEAAVRLAQTAPVEPKEEPPQGAPTSLPVHL